MIANKTLEKNSIAFITLLMCIAIAGEGLLRSAEAQDSIRWYTMKEAQKLAREHDKKVFVFNEASWCIYCKKMEKKVFPKQGVIDSMKTYYFPVKVDIESDQMMEFNGQKMTQQQFAHSFKIRATPTILFIDNEGKVLGMQPGYIPANTFRVLLSFVGSGAFQETGFKQYRNRHEPVSAVK